MTTTNPYPVDSTTRSCCGGIGRHTRTCTAAPCTLPWCERNAEHDLHTSQDAVHATDGRTIGVALTWAPVVHPEPSLSVSIYDPERDDDCWSRLSVADAIQLRDLLDVAISHALGHVTTDQPVEVTL